jgi:hypothetical protein
VETLMSESLRVDGQRLRADLESLAEIGRAPSGGINRTAFSDADVSPGSGTATVALRRDWN